MMAALVWVKMLSRLIPECSNILEIGPGQGYSAFFLQKFFKNLRKYHAIDVTMPFYLLQSLIYENKFSGYNELALHDMHLIEKKYNDLRGKHIEESRALPRNEIYCREYATNIYVSHYPWWRTFELFEMIEDSSLDCVVANACLNEIHQSALQMYLKLISKKLKPTGKLFYQCSGAFHDGRNIQHILGTNGFEPKFLLKGNVAINNHGEQLKFLLDYGFWEKSEKNTTFNGVVTNFMSSDFKLDKLIFEQKSLIKKDQIKKSIRLI
jgi:SAM-dependent methyltransferase